MNLKKLAILGVFAIALAWLLQLLSGWVNSLLPAAVPGGKIVALLISGATILISLVALAFVFRKLKLHVHLDGIAA
jgi:hypothetical protein